MQCSSFPSKSIEGEQAITYPEQAGTYARTDPADVDQAVSGWTGWIFFAGIMMILIGSFSAIQGLVALFNTNYYLVGPEGLIINVDFTTWGWVHLIFGVLVLVMGFDVRSGNTAARVIGIVLALLSAIANLAFLAAYPIWSTIVITLVVLVISALSAHGRELRTCGGLSPRV